MIHKYICCVLVCLWVYLYYSSYSNKEMKK